MTTQYMKVQLMTALSSIEIIFHTVGEGGGVLLGGYLQYHVQDRDTTSQYACGEVPGKRTKSTSFPGDVSWG